MIEVKIEGTKMIITADIEKGYLSGSGRNIVVITSHGYQPVVEGQYKLSLNVIKKA